MTQQEIPKVSPQDTWTIFTDVVAPTAAKGVIIRRPPMVDLAQRLGLDQRAVDRLQKVRDKQGEGPFMLRTLGQPRAIVVDPRHVRRILEESPEVFAVASSEKQAALAHFEPQNVLVSHGPKRDERRRFNEQVLQSEQVRHDLADSFDKVVQEEATYMLERARRQGGLAWDDFFDGWFRVIRRVVLGDSAADDRELIDMIEKLRATGNWAFLHPGRPQLRDQFFSRLKSHLDRAEPRSLAAIIANVPKTEDTLPHQQIPQYLSASDPAGMATFRTLALLASHPDHAARAQQEIDEAKESGAQEYPFLRACVLESLRLWPTAPLILRETTRETTWASGIMPKGTSILIFVPYFHRNRALPHAHRFTPELWLQEQKEDEWPLIPFSGGPAICPGRQLVLTLTSTMIANLLQGREIHMVPHDRLRADQPMPGTLNQYDLSFEFTPRSKKAPLSKQEKRPAIQVEAAQAPEAVRGVEAGSVATQPMGGDGHSR